MADRKNYTTIAAKGFKKEIERLSVIERALVFAKIEIMEHDPFYPSLRTKKLKGDNEGRFESSVNMDIRIIWRFDDGKIIFLLDVGHHDVLRKY